jgi:hypothetical protein
MMAYQVTVMNEHDIFEVFELDMLNLDQLRRFSRNVGVPYVNKCTKFQCRKGLWILANHQEQLEKYGGHVTTAEERVSSNVIRLCNVIFGHDFLDDLLALNDGKNRVDHETGGMPSDFWAGVTEALNCASDDDATASTVIIAEEDPHYEEVMELDLNDYDQMTSAVVRKKFNLLMKIWKIIRKNMTLSGKHDNDAFNFVELAMKKAGSCTGVSVLGVYYFHALCDANPDIDVNFADEMDDALMGNTNQPLDSLETWSDDGVDAEKRSDGTTSAAVSTPKGRKATNKNETNESANEKKRSYSAVVDMSDTGVSIRDQMIETNRLVKQNQIIMLAQHLNKEDILEEILSNLRSDAAGSNA